MTQYDDHRWIEHSFVNEKIVQFLTQKLKPIMKKIIQVLIIMLVNIYVARNLYNLFTCFNICILMNFWLL